jgi:uncharacterized protein YdeI (YjbR/CyaY-like superfamily)
VTGEQGKDGKPILTLASEAAWEAWLDAEHATSDGVWLKFAKKGSGVETVVYAEALDVALCYGWIDSQVSRLDGRFYLQKFTPRRARSKWSQVNRAKIEELTKQGPDEAAGLAQVEAGEGRRPLGRRLRVARERRDAGRPAGRLDARSEGGRVLGRPQPR